MSEEAVDEMRWCPRCERGMPASRCTPVELGVFAGERALTCPTCQGVTRGVEVVEHRPMPAHFLDALRFPAVDDGAYAWIGLGVGLWFFSHLPWIGGAASVCIFVTYALSVVQHVARGRKGMPMPTEFTHLDDYLFPAFRAGLAMLPGLFPMVLALGAGAGLPRWLYGALGGVTATFALAWLPGALAWASMGPGWFESLDPRAVLAMAQRAPRDYLRVVGAVWALALGQSVVLDVSRALSYALRVVPVLPGVLAWTLAVFLPLVMARVVGTFLRERATELGLDEAR